MSKKWGPLHDLTLRVTGDHRPKQFCPIAGPESLLRQTRRRLDPIVPAGRQAFVVSREHERYYRNELADAEDSLIIAQPVNRGTAVAIIVALVHIMQADPEAVVGFLPCDHYYADDASFRSMVRSAALAAELFPRSLIVVGAAAEYPEIEYGWLEPESAALHSEAGTLARVSRFWEKPALPQAETLWQSGCLWNTFVTMGTAETFLELVCSEVPDVVLSLTRALADGDLSTTYGRLPSVDFSRDILARHSKRLLLLRDSDSGWADLGSPERVLQILARSVDPPTWFHELSVLSGVAS